MKSLKHDGYDQTDQREREGERKKLELGEMEVTV